jgi:hypothetical protein
LGLGRLRAVEGDEGGTQMIIELAVVAGVSWTAAKIHSALKKG